MQSLDICILRAHFQIFINIHLQLAIIFFIPYSEVVLSQILHLLSLYTKHLIFQGLIQSSMILITTGTRLDFKIGRGAILGFVEKIGSYLRAKVDIV